MAMKNGYDETKAMIKMAYGLWYEKWSLIPVNTITKKINSQSSKIFPGINSDTVFEQTRLERWKSIKSFFYIFICQHLTRCISVRFLRPFSSSTLLSVRNVVLIWGSYKNKVSITVKHKTVSVAYISLAAALNNCSRIRQYALHINLHGIHEWVIH